MFQTVLTQDHHRALGTQAAVDETLRNVARGGPSLCISDMSPFTQAAIGQFNSACKQGLVGFVVCPVLQAIRETIWVSC